MSNEAKPPFTVESVDEAPAPRRARVDEAVMPQAGVEAGPEAGVEAGAESGERKRDYLDGFLAEKPQGTSPGEPGGAIYDGVIDALKEIYDPEIPVNIYDLGLIYAVDVSPEASVAVTMTLTTPHCPVAESMPGEVELRVCAVPGVRDAEVNLVWDPPWDMAKMSDEAKLELGML